MKPGLTREKCLHFEPIDCSIEHGLGGRRRHTPASVTYRNADATKEGLTASSLFPAIDAHIDRRGEHSDFGSIRIMAAG